ncbi:hypothetical protein [Kitasatospora purpeofusca]|uniref:hypothetical protein n=1 Tax=Kitasatospora purpeofusca TaxID=67352 RepID=UPI00224D511F|nr:hypothetical protein [Kitasatospora purpeofusca]MCX4755964.1 hypothetical protein [Kitasatospora purpeofusca]WSR36188.1 hypothetical protein OG715_37725 [Kitasatospora purpeofusca]
MTTKWTGVWLEDVRLDVAGIGGMAFRPDPSAELPERVEVYRILDGRGEPLPCTPAEHERWELAALACLDRLSRALEDFYWAHGGTRIEIDLASGRGTRWGIGRPRRWPGWERRTVERSARAQHVLALEVRRAVEEYRPVSAEVALRVAEALAARRAAMEAEQEATRHRRAVLDESAGRRVWQHRSAGSGEPVLVRRVDLPGPGAAAGTSGGSMTEDQEPLTARELADALNALARRAESPVDIRWDERATAVTEAECLAQEVHLTFLEWWHDLAGPAWRPGPHGPAPVFVPPGQRSSAPRQSFGGTGMGGTGGFSGGHSYGGFGGY